MFCDTSLDETNYDAFDPPIPEECLERNIDKTHTNAQPQQFQVGDVMLLIQYLYALDHKREYATKKSPLTYGQTFLQMI